MGCMRVFRVHKSFAKLWWCQSNVFLTLNEWKISLICGKYGMWSDATYGLPLFHIFNESHSFIHSFIIHCADFLHSLCTLHNKCMHFEVQKLVLHTFFFLNKWQRVQNEKKSDTHYPIWQIYRLYLTWNLTLILHSQVQWCTKLFLKIKNYFAISKQK